MVVKLSQRDALNALWDINNDEIFGEAECILSELRNILKEDHSRYELKYLHSS